MRAHLPPHIFPAFLYLLLTSFHLNLQPTPPPTPP
jgi:hypothetical protein